jgi:hypothetical protein
MMAKCIDATKLRMAKMIAKEGRCFILERGGVGAPYWLLYRECYPRNVLVGKRSSIDGILSLVNKATTTKTA